MQESSFILKTNYCNPVLILVARIGFIDTAVNVTEGEGKAILRVALLSKTSLSAKVIVGFSTSDVSTTGEG